MEVRPLKVDLHSHLIPGIDDGAQSEQDTLELVRGMYELGYRKLITTPHIYRGVFNNTAEIILSGLEKVRRLFHDEYVDMEIAAAAEYFFDNYLFEQVEKKELLTFGDNYLLFELPTSSRPEMLDDIIDMMKTSGYKPVLAHPERYPYFHEKKMTGYQSLKDQGVFFQLNLMSFTGYYNESVKRAALDLAGHNFIDFAGSDLHRAKHLGALFNARQHPAYEKLMASGKLLNDTL